MGSVEFKEIRNNTPHQIRDRVKGVDVNGEVSMVTTVRLLPGEPVVIL